jgi:hypothetical protein
VVYIDRIVYCSCVVRTGNRHPFSHISSSCKLVCGRPEGLVRRVDVDKMVASPPDSPDLTLPSSGNSNAFSAATKRARSSADSIDSDQPTPSKKSRVEQSNKGITLRYLYLQSTCQWLLYVQPSLIFNKPMFCPHSVLMCLVWSWSQKVFVSLIQH